MAELILHQFASSPFSEKVRLMLGYKQLAWKSVEVPNMMPKPDVLALTGGYRRTPFLQIGADIYCDTALIADVLERFKPTPALYPEPGQALARILGQWADNTLFWSAIRYKRGANAGGAAAELPKAIFEDRKAMGFDIEWQQPADAAPAYQAYLRMLSELLQDQPYLLGEQASMADFCASHALWFVHVRPPAVPQPLAGMPALKGWLKRMLALGHGTSAPMDSAQAITIAATSEPAPAGENLLDDSGFQDEHGIALGSRVTVTAESFGLEPTGGELIAATRTHYSLRRTDPRAGTVHVHFPRIGYLLKRP